MTPFLRDKLRLAKIPDTSSERLASEFSSLWPEVWIKIMVQEPWQGTIRFKQLARATSAGIESWIESPLDELTARYGGGKYKINFYAGETFAATQNFRTEGEPLWQRMPELKSDL